MVLRSLAAAPLHVLVLVFTWDQVPSAPVGVRGVWVGFTNMACQVFISIAPLLPVVVGWVGACEIKICRAFVSLSRRHVT